MQATFEHYALIMKRVLTADIDGPSDRSVVSWNEFKMYRIKCAAKKQQLVDFLE